MLETNAHDHVIIISIAIFDSRGIIAYQKISRKREDTLIKLFYYVAIPP